MSLLTPPSTAHRGDKENRTPGSSRSSRVAWSQFHQIHNLSASPKPIKCTSAKRNPPAKSILKEKSLDNFPLFDLDPAELDPKPREETPEPEDSLADLHYLEGPVITICSDLATMRELNEAYGRLMSRIRGAMAGATDGDATWPLFQPIRSCNIDFVAGVVRDLRKALEDPSVTFPDVPEDLVETECEDKAAYSLPSPKSPRKKIGMSAKQVKYARDLCSTSHSAMKFLGMIMALPALYSVFTDTQLREMLAQVLAIPTADTLPTPNARKTCALAIWVLQVQRLPSTILQPLSDRVAYAIRRGLDGELGKEGKKGSATDGLKAIHDLCVFQPSTFLPAFTNILDSVLSNLLAPTLALRVAACHALGGIVLALIALPRSSTHTRVSNIITDYLTRTPQSPAKKLSSSPSKLDQEALIFRTLRATLNASEPAQSAQGPVWALVVLACFVIMLGPTLVQNAKIFRTISTFLSLPMRHKKSSVRALGCLVWRTVAWVYFLPVEPTKEKTCTLASDALKEKQNSVWRALLNVSDFQSGMAFIAALLSNDDIDVDDGLKRSMTVLEHMVQKQTNISDVVETLKRLVSLQTNNSRWNVNRFIIPAIFTPNPGLLTIEYKSLPDFLNDVVLKKSKSPLQDIRFLTREEIAQDWVFDAMIGIWKQALTSLKNFDQSEISSVKDDLLSVWEGLLNAFGSTLQDAGDEDGMMEFTYKTTGILVDILEDNELNLLSSKKSREDNSSSAFRQTSGECKLQLVSQLWNIVNAIYPESTLSRAGHRLLNCLTKIEEELIESNDNARVVWVALCVRALSVCDVDAMKTFWDFETGGPNWDWDIEVRNTVWRTAIERWSEDGGSWEGAVVLLAVPFTSSKAQMLGHDDSKKWENLLQYAFNKALDYGIDSNAVLDSIASLISQDEHITGSACTQVADLLMSQLDMKDIREIPEMLMEFVNNTMTGTYPPESGNQDISRWMIRTLTSVIEQCPAPLGSQLLELVQDGICAWVADNWSAWSLDDYEYEIVPLYVQVLFCIQSQKHTIENLEKFTSLIESGYIGRSDKPQLLQTQFETFWNSSYGTWEVPTGSLPEGIQRCLGITRGDSPELGEEVSVPTSLAFNSSLLEPEPESEFEFGQLQPEPKTPQLGTTELESELATPTTPTSRATTTSKLVPPPHPSKRLSSGLLFPLFPLALSPTSPSRIRVMPMTMKHSRKRSLNVDSHSQSVSKRRKIDDKENISPRGRDDDDDDDGHGLRFNIPSITERIAVMHSSPGSVTSTPISTCSTKKMSKRRLEEHEHEDSTLGSDLDLGRNMPSPLKRGRTNGHGYGYGQGQGRGQMRNRSPSVCSTASDDSLEEQAIVASMLTLDSSPSPREIEEKEKEKEGKSNARGSSSNSRLFMEAVEVPSFEEVLLNKRLRRPASLGNLPSSNVKKVELVRTPSMGGGRFIQKMKIRPGGKSTTMEKKEKKEYTFGPLFLASTTKIKTRLSSIPPLPLLPISNPNSNPNPTPSRNVKTQMKTKMKTKTKTSGLAPVPTSSSDDDPRYGQVTPHHLISPAPINRRFSNMDPPSDDSLLSSSPIKQVVSRRIIRRRKSMESAF